MLEHLLTELCNKLDLPLNLTKDKEGYYPFTLNNEISFHIKELNPGFFVKAILGEVINGSHEELYTLLMKANFLGQGTAGAFLGMDTKAKNFTLTKACKQETSYREFKDFLEEFVNYFEYWKKRIKTYNDTKS